ncbi:MAG: pilus assembly protein PilX [Aquabacterium sp.]
MTTMQHKQRGTTLLFALITLVVLMLATLGLVRSVDTGTMLLGNIGFKQDATSTADRASRQAIKWLSDNRSALNTNLQGGGYYASTQEFDVDGTTARPPVDATGKQLYGQTNRQLIDWDGNNCSATDSRTYTGCTIAPASAGEIQGNQASYVIFRLCSKAGDYTTDTSIQCAKPMTAGATNASGRGDLNYAEPTRFNTTSGPYYRIVVRVLGARNTASFTETIVHF